MKTRRITLFGIPFDTVSPSQALLKLHYYSQLEEGDQKICVTPNPEMIVEAAQNPEFYAVLQKSDFALADGTGILWASGFLPLSTLDIPSLILKKFKWRYFFAALGSLLHFIFSRNTFSREIQSRVTGTDICARFLGTTHARVFLLGGQPGAAKAIAADLQNVVGVFDGAVTPESTAEIIAAVNVARAEALFVGLGSPKQELWIAQNLAKMPTVRFAMGVGGAFDFLSGMRKRAPSWMQSLGLEWLYRLIREPYRFRRIWNATARFFILTVRERGAIME